MYIEIDKLSENAHLPKAMTKHSACLDVEYCLGDQIRVNAFDHTNTMVPIYPNEQDGNTITIMPGWRVMVPTSLRLRIPPHWHVKVFARSGLSIKTGLLMVNSVGIIDADYDNELMVLLINTAAIPVSITEYDRIAQIQYCKNTDVFYFDEEVNKGLDRTGGFGSTG